jgi:O-antigen/teichoic acid export membrane protein
MTVAGSLTESLLGTADANEHAGVGELNLRVRHRRSRPQSLRSTASRQRVIGLTVVDQGFSSANSFALAFGIAHYSHANVLGIFAVVNTTWILVQGLIRSLTSDCLMTRHDDDNVMGKYERAGYISAIVSSSVAALLVLLVSLAFSGELRLTFIILAVSLPLLSAQDYSRYLGISRYNPAYAIGLDCAWLSLSIVGYFVLRHAGLITLPWILAAWSAAGALVGLYTLWNHLILRDARQLVRFWFKSERGVGIRFAGQWLLGSSWVYIAIYVFAAIFSVAVVGEFKLAQVIFGPITVMTQGGMTALVAVASRYFQVNRVKAMRFVFLAGVGSALVTLIWLVGIYYLPVHIGTKLLGPAWPAARALVPLVGLAFAITCITNAAAAGMRSLRAAKENLRVVMVMMPVVLACCLTGGVVWGIKAAVIGLCIGFSIDAVVWWSTLFRVSRRMALNADEPEDPTVAMAEFVADATPGALGAPTAVGFEVTEPV